MVSALDSGLEQEQGQGQGQETEQEQETAQGSALVLD
jgi:hypothetical protein